MGATLGAFCSFMGWCLYEEFVIIRMNEIIICWMSWMIISVP